MKKQLTIRTCDECGKKVENDGQPLVGGAVDGGWLTVEIRCGSTMLAEMCKPHTFDFCSKKCCIENLQKQE